MGIDKIYYLNNIEQSNKAQNGSVIYKNLPEIEYAELIKKGQEVVLDKL